jgi:hypothetical protein
MSSGDTKHVNDVLRLSQLLALDVRIAVAPRIAQDRSIDPKSVGVNGSVAQIVERIAMIYEWNRRREI